VAVPRARLEAALDRRNAEATAYPLSVTLGLSLFDPNQPCSFWDLVERADREMYQLKKKGVRAGP
jgi:GGDEF domain-containing protein